MENLVLTQQHKKDLSGSATKNQAVTSSVQKTKATYMKKPQPLGNLQNKPHPHCEHHDKPAKMRVVKELMQANYGRPFFICSDQSEQRVPFGFGVMCDL